jgi:hypothetical protein
MDYHRSKAYEGDVIEKNANMYYRIVSLLCAPIYRPVIKKHMMVLVSNYANVISAQGYSASPFRVESRRWIREAIYCAIDASGERDIENTRALCGMDARLVLKSLWEEYSKFFKFKGKV